MPYLRDIPQGDHTLTQDQPALRNNFSEIDAVLGNDHCYLDDAIPARAGKHALVRITSLAAKPNTTATNVAIYNSVSNITNREELFFAAASNAAAHEFTSSINNELGFTRLPSGIAYKWGWAMAESDAVTTINLNHIGTPNFNYIFTTLLTPATNSEITRAGSLELIEQYNYMFRAYNNYNTDIGFYYLVIGS